MSSRILYLNQIISYKFSICSENVREARIPQASELFQIPQPHPTQTQRNAQQSGLNMVLSPYTISLSFFAKCVTFKHNTRPLCPQKNK